MSKWFKFNGNNNKNNGGNQPKSKKRRKDRDDLNSMKRGGSVMEDSDHEDQDHYNDQYQQNNSHHNQHSNSHSQSYNDHHSQSSYNNQSHRQNENGSSRSNKSSPSRALTKSQDKLYVGDKILLANKKSGKIISLGPKPDKEGIWVRVGMGNVHMNADNDQRNKNKSIWVPIQRVDRIISHGKKFDLTIDDRVIERKKGIPGTIMYVGPTHFDEGVWFGVALDTPKGENNGTVKKKFYFLSEPNHGVMLPYKKLEHENKNRNKKSPRKQRSHSQNFEKEENQRRNGNHNGNHSNHQKTNSDGVVNKKYIAQQLQLDQLQQRQQEQQQQNDHQTNNNNNNNHHHPTSTKNNSNSSNDYDYDPEYENGDMVPGGSNKTPSSDSDVQMFMQLKPPQSASSSPRKRNKVNTKKKNKVNTKRSRQTFEEENNQEIDWDDLMDTIWADVPFKSTKKQYRGRSRPMIVQFECIFCSHSVITTNWGSQSTSSECRGNMKQHIKRKHEDKIPTKQKLEKAKQNKRPKLSNQ
mmetsp:Transcript_49863/g.44674  ORF Transcript_49863/g.44674 Transcript_49863/m.44674 type:complete len:522 (-) Transcript_49863:146-1711(-)